VVGHTYQQQPQQHDHQQQQQHTYITVSVMHTRTNLVVANYVLVRLCVSMMQVLVCQKGQSGLPAKHSQSGVNMSPS
jgi:hypothetical protein